MRERRQRHTTSFWSFNQDRLDCLHVVANAIRQFHRQRKPLVTLDDLTNRFSAKGDLDHLLNVVNAHADS